IDNVFVWIITYSTATYCSGAISYAYATYACECIGEPKYQGKVAVASATSTFDASATGQRKVNVKSSGSTVGFARGSASELHWICRKVDQGKKYIPGGSVIGLVERAASNL